MNLITHSCRSHTYHTSFIKWHALNWKLLKKHGEMRTFIEPCIDLKSTTRINTKTIFSKCNYIWRQWHIF